MHRHEFIHTNVRSTIGFGRLQQLLCQLRTLVPPRPAQRARGGVVQQRWLCGVALQRGQGFGCAHGAALV